MEVLANVSYIMTMTSKTMTGVLGAAAFAGVLTFAPVAFAVGVTTGASVGVQASSTRGAASSTAALGVSVNASTTASTTVGAHGTTTGGERRPENPGSARSAVAVSVQALLDAANRDGGIGQEVRLIAQGIASTTASTSEAKAKVESRPGWLIFLIGSDYGNLGTLRSDIVTTQNQIQRLTAARARTADVSVQATLDAQILALQASASSTVEFVADHEGSFSLFGWLVRLFD